MTTAREKLYEEIVALVQNGAGASADGEMRKIMARYRVQTKPGIDIAPGATARDALGDRLLKIWRDSAGTDASKVIGTTIDEFRMQMKGAGGSVPPKPARPSTSRVPMPAILEDDDPPPRQEARPPSRTAPPVPAAEPARAAKPGRAVAEPVAGGPRKRGKSRGECPKCHSMGVVLARSYAGDEYFSCIYCGWQAYKPVDEDDPNASLAVRLLGQSVPESRGD
jgi:hypothetical protein